MISEKLLSEYLGVEETVIVSRATTAIYLILKSLAFKTGKVILPNITCPAPAYAVIFAGFEPYFCDVRKDNYTLDPGSLEKALENNKDVRAVIPIHLYGYPADMEPVNKICKKFGIFILEDAAQSMGGRYHGRKMGAWGEAAVLSFGPQKILDLGGGGAICTNDRNLAKEARGLDKTLPKKSPWHDELEKQRLRFYYAIQEMSKINPKASLVYRNIPEMYELLYIYQDKNPSLPNLPGALPGLPDALQRRREMAVFLDEHLQHESIIRPEVPWEDIAVWRYTFRLNLGARDDILAKMRERSFDISSWYPCLDRQFFPGLSPLPDLTVSRSLEKSLVNLWVDETVNLSKCADMADNLLELIEETGRVAC